MEKYVFLSIVDFIFCKVPPIVSAFLGETILFPFNGYLHPCQRSIDVWIFSGISVPLVYMSVFMSGMTWPLCTEDFFKARVQASLDLTIYNPGWSLRSSYLNLPNARIAGVYRQGVS